MSTAHVGTPVRPMVIPFSVLGPVELRIAGASRTPGARKLRMLLALLLIRANSTVSTDLVIRELWDDNATPSAVPAIRVYVSQLRKLIAEPRTVGPFGGDPDDGPAWSIVTRAPGYMLCTSADCLDMTVFERYRQRAGAAWSAGRADAAADEYRKALSLWRGPALSDVRSGPLLSGAAQLLEEAWIATLERRIDADLSLGRHRDLIGEIRSLTTEYTMHEGLHARLMVALYQAGRTGEALDVYHRMRMRLNVELGVEPGLELRRTHLAVLRSDVELRHFQ